MSPTIMLKYFDFCCKRKTMKLLIVLVVFVSVNCAIADDLKNFNDKCEHANCTVDGIKINNNDSQKQKTIVIQDVDRAAMPTAMNMLMEDDEHHQHSSTPPSIFVTMPSATDAAKGRAINFTLDEHHTENGISANHSAVSVDDKDKNYKDISDVSMDDEEDEEIQKSPLIPNLTHSINHTLGVCIKGGLTYSNGEKIEDGCETVCTCMNGQMDCTDRCVGPYFRKGKKIDDPLCTEKAVDDPCCSILVCAADTETEPLEMCSYQNKTYHRGEKITDGCSQVCLCETAGKISCKPRCRPIQKTSDRCVEVPDPNDSCCKMILCDVSLDDHEHKDQEIPKMKLLSAKYINSTTILFKFDSKSDDKNSLPDIELSEEKQKWTTYRLMPGGYLQFTNNNLKYARLENTEDSVVIQNAELGASSNIKKDDNLKTCSHEDKTYKVGEEFYKNCSAFCICLETGVKCLQIQCPTYFGLDAVDPTCLEWETVPPNFVPNPPNCCPQEVKCKSNGSCIHDGHMYQNWQELPVNVTGCDKRCYCEMSKVECQPACPPVPAVPPANLPCLPHEAILDHLPDDDCCKHWICASSSLPHGTDDKTPKKTDKQRLDNSNNRTVTKKQFPPTTPITPILNVTQDHLPSPDFKGPLLIYENDKPIKNKNKTIITDSSDLQNLHDTFINKPDPNAPNSVDKYKNIKSESDLSGPWIVNPSKTNSKQTIKDPNSDLPKNPSYVGPFNPDFKNPLVKPKKGNKTLNSNTGNVNKQKVEPSVPQKVPQQMPYNPQHPQYTNIQHPEEILQIINQHPELSNYPSGSVFEIHNFPQNNPQKLSPDYVLSQNKFPNKRPPVPPQQQSPLGPYLINQIDPSGSQNLNTNNFSPNLPIDQLIKHVQEGRLPPGLPRPIAPYSQNAEFSPQNPIFAQPGLQYSVLNNQPQLNNSTAAFGGFGGRFPNVPGFQQSPDEITVQQVEAIDAQTVRLIFTVSPLIVGLHGRVEVRYTSQQDSNIANWELQVFAPPNDLIATQQLEFDLIGLQPNTEYKIKITVILRDLHNTPTSQVYSVRTPNQSAFSTMPPMIPIEPNLVVTDVNSTWANIVWRKLTDFELQFVDGVQLRFKEITGKVYAATPLIHRAVTSYTLENLKPDTEYEVGIFFIPFTGQNTELHSEHMVHFTTSSEIDPYGFNVTLEIQLVKATTLDIAWSGVPYPEDKYVNIYRAIYQSDSGKGDFSTFKIAKRDSPKKTTITELKPGTRYRLWLEVYLTNGKIKNSNVQDFITKPRSPPALGASTQQGKLSAAEEVPDHSNDYYGPLVIVAILAAIAILSTLILLLILLRRYSQNKAPISSPARVSQSAYDNPTYKVEIQQETMGL